MALALLAAPGALAQERPPIDPTDGCQVDPHVQHDIRLWITCEPDHCGIAVTPVCWTVRFSCYYLEGPLDAVTDETHCQSHDPDDVTRSTQTDNELLATAEPVFEAVGCDNYGVLVNILSDRCPGTPCDNHGIEVGVFSHNCERDDWAYACVDNYCVSADGLVRQAGPAAERLFGHAEL